MKSIILLFSLQRMIIDWSIYKHGYDFVCTIAILWRSLLHLTLVTIVLHCCITVYTLSYSVLTSLMHLWIFYKTFPLITSDNMPKKGGMGNKQNLPFSVEFLTRYNLLIFQKKFVSDDGGVVPSPLIKWQWPSETPGAVMDVSHHSHQSLQLLMMVRINK